jgi:hypothetical protein
MLIIEAVQENIDPTQHVIEHGYDINEGSSLHATGGQES